MAKSEGNGLDIAALYMEQYGHWELPQTSQIFKRYVGKASKIVSLNLSVKKIQNGL